MRNRLLLIAAVLLPAVFSESKAIEWSDATEVTRTAVNNSVLLRARQSDLAAAKEAAARAGLLPPPMALAGVESLQVDLSHDPMMTMYVIGASQAFVPSRTRKARASSAGLAVTRIESDLASLRADIARDALFRYFELAAIDSQRKAVERQKILAESIIAAVRVRYETGRSTQADVVRAQIQETAISHQLLSLREQRRILAALLAASMNLDPVIEIPELGLEHHMMMTGGSALDDEGSPATTPLLAALEAQIDEAGQVIELAALEGKPSWNIEATYGMRPEETDVISVLARVELPYPRNARVEPRVREAVARRDALRLQLDALRREVWRDLTVARIVRDETLEQITLHEKVLIPQARMVFESSMAAYQAGQADFVSLLETEKVLISLELDFFDFLARHRKADADVSAILAGARGAISSTPMTPAGMATDRSPSQPMRSME